MSIASSADLRAKMVERFAEYEKNALEAAEELIKKVDDLNTKIKNATPTQKKEDVPNWRAELEQLMRELSQYDNIARKADEGKTQVAVAEKSNRDNKFRTLGQLFA
ncbi:MAG: hypothetical protein AAFZ18_11310 [Myxococcota bacterium]